MCLIATAGSLLWLDYAALLDDMVAKDVPQALGRKLMVQNSRLVALLDTFCGRRTQN